MPDPAPTPVQPGGILSPGQKQYLFIIALSFLFGWLAKHGVTPAPLPPFPAEIPAMMKEMHSDIKQLKASFPLKVNQ